ncbi:MAG: hypothetical protein ACJARS_002513 [bacterium]|jgi:hypothetical protein
MGGAEVVVDFWTGWKGSRSSSEANLIDGQANSLNEWNHLGEQNA